MLRSISRESRLDARAERPGSRSQRFAARPNIGPVELVIVLVIALLVIGPGKLPDVGSALGKSIREFRKAATDVQESVNLDAPVAQAPGPTSPVAAVVPNSTPAGPLP